MQKLIPEFTETYKMKVEQLQNSFRTLSQAQKQPIRAQKVKNYPNIKSKSNARVEGNIENESCSTTRVDPKTFVKPYSNPQSSLLGPHKTKMTQKLRQIQMSEFKES